PRPGASASSSGASMRLLIASYRVDQEHICELAQQAAVGQGTVARFPRPQEARQAPGGQPLHPVDRPEINPVDVRREEACGAELSAQPSRGGEELFESDEAAQWHERR